MCTHNKMQNDSFYKSYARNQEIYGPLLCVMFALGQPSVPGQIRMHQHCTKTIDSCKTMVCVDVSNFCLEVHRFTL